MEIMGLRFGCRNRNGQDAGSLDGYSVILILQDAFHPKEFLSVDHHAVFLIKVRIHNYVRNSCLIFETQKRQSLLPFPDAAERLRILLSACIARPARKANRSQDARSCSANHDLANTRSGLTSFSSVSSARSAAR